MKAGHRSYYNANIYFSSAKLRCFVGNVTFNIYDCDYMHADESICFDVSKRFQTLCLEETSGYATWFTAGGAIRIAHHDVIDDVITRKV